MRYAVVFAVMLVAGCGYFAEPNYLTSYPSEYTQGGEPVTWYTTNFPLPVHMDEGMTPAQRQAVRDAVARWNLVVGAQVFQDPIVVPWTHPSLDREVPGVVSVTSAQVRLSNTLAQAHWTVYRYSPDRMQHVRIVLDPDTRESVLVNVMVHELGHALGLAHDPERCSVMHRQTDEVVRTITTEDIEYVRWQLP